MEALTQEIKTKKVDYLTPFLQSRKSMNVSLHTIELYYFVLERFLSYVGPDKAKGRDIHRYLAKIPANGVSLGNRHAHYRVIKTFFRWLALEYGIKSPMSNVKSPQLPKLILPSLTKEQVLMLIDIVEGIRNKAIIALLTESGLRVTELAGIKIEDIDWENGVIRTLGKGQKEAYAPFGELSRQYLKSWLNQYDTNGSIWDINKFGIQIMLQRLRYKSGLPCNAHTFRRTFACLLRKAGVDTMTIKDLGRWESLEMVQRYTRSVTFQDSLKFYKAPLDY
jgi:integrase/recombinase XerD